MERAWFERIGAFVRRGLQHDWALLKNLMESVTSIEEDLLSRLITPFVTLTNSYGFEPAACSSRIEGELVDAPRRQLDSLPFPDDVTLLVLCKLAAQDCAALARASCTCKSLNRLIAGDGDLWRVAFRKEGVPGHPSPDGLDEAVDAFGGYRALIGAHATRSSRKVEALLNLFASGLNTDFLLLGCLEGNPVAWAKAEASGPPDVYGHVRICVGLWDLRSGIFTAYLVICLGPDDSDPESTVVQIDLRSQRRWHRDEHALLEGDEAQQRRGLDVQGFALDQNDPSELILLFDTREHFPPGHVYRIWAPW
jgi:hypothetical protein